MTTSEEDGNECASEEGWDGTWEEENTPNLVATCEIARLIAHVQHCATKFLKWLKCLWLQFTVSGKKENERFRERVFPISVSASPFLSESFAISTKFEFSYINIRRTPFYSSLQGEACGLEKAFVDIKVRSSDCQLECRAATVMSSTCTYTGCKIVLKNCTSKASSEMTSWHF